MTDEPGRPEGNGESAGVPLTRKDAAQGRSASPSTDPAVALQAQIRAARSDFEHKVEHARSEFDEVNERIKERTGRDLIVATLIGLAIGATLVGSLVFFSWLFVFLALAAALLAVFELGRALITSGRRVDVVPQLIAAGALILSGFFLDLWLHWVLVFVAVAFVISWRLVAQMAARDGRTYGDVLADVLTAGFVQLYVPFLTSMTMILVRQDHGEWWVLAFIIVVVASDTGAYASGLTFGRTKMAPRISPNKTWEGFAGAAVAATVAGVLVGMFMLGIHWWMGAILGIVVLATATVGDLGESMIKRDMGIKDMSSWLPGHGGVLDRLDSILPSAVVALALYFLFTPWMA